MVKYRVGSLTNTLFQASRALITGHQYYTYPSVSRIDHNYFIKTKPRHKTSAMQAAWPATTSHPHLPTALALFTCPEAQQPVLHKFSAVFRQRNLLHPWSPVWILGQLSARRTNYQSVSRGGWPRWWKTSRESHTGGWGLFVSSALRSKGWGVPSSQPTTSSRGAAHREGADLLWWAPMGYEEVEVQHETMSGEFQTGH